MRRMIRDRSTAATTSPLCSPLPLVLGAVVGAGPAARAIGRRRRRQAREGLRPRRQAFGSMRFVPRLQGHVLEPYVDYWQLKAADRRRQPRRRSCVPGAHATPVAERLRVDWLKSLGRAAPGATSRSNRRPRRRTPSSRALRCSSAASSTGHAAPPARALWLTGPSTPDLCEPVWSAMFAGGELADADRHARMRLAAEAGNVRLPRRWPRNPACPTTSREGHRGSRPRSVRALARGEFAWKTAERTRPRALRARARRTQGRRRRPRGLGEVAHHLPDERSRATPHRLSRGAAAQSVGQRLVPRTRCAR